MRKINSAIFLLYVLLIGLLGFCDENQEVMDFFNNYVKMANSHSMSMLDYYDTNAKIIRVVEKPDGTTKSVAFSMSEYAKQLKLGSKLAKVKKYKNYYTDVNISKSDDTYKIDTLRQPSSEKYKLPAYFVVKRDSNGSLKIITESMNTKVQTFLKYAK